MILLLIFVHLVTVSTYYMFEQLPKTLQQQVLNCLAADNFVLAKQLYDAWLTEEAIQQLPPVEDSPAQG